MPAASPNSWTSCGSRLPQGKWYRRPGDNRKQDASAETPPAKPLIKPDEALSPLRDVLENHRIEVEEGCVADDLEAWVADEKPVFDLQKYGFTEFAELLNFAQDKKSVVRVQPDEEEGLLVYLGAILSACVAGRPRSTTPERTGHQ